MSGFQTQLRAALPELWRYAYALTRNRDIADDLVQDCVERALRKRLLWMTSRPLKPWLMRILLNLFRNHVRRFGHVPVVSLDDAGPMAANSASPELQLEVRSVIRDLAGLPPEQREALLLVVAGGLSYSEAAEALGIPQGTLMSRISRARSALKRAQDAPPKLRSIK